jgi:diguanylate cyclase (GGDEF)-like protein
MARDRSPDDAAADRLPRSWHAAPASSSRRRRWRPPARRRCPWSRVLRLHQGERAAGPAARRLVRRRAIQGALLALGAPLGWLTIQALTGSSPSEQVSQHPGLYAYLLLATAVVLFAVGALIGRAEESLELANDLLTELSYTDAGTGLKNRRYLEARLEEELAEAQRRGGPVALAILDLDAFKAVNDRFGHPTGDELLASVGGALLSVSRRGETVARLGGEEFAILLPGSSGPEAEAAAERARQAVEATRLRGPSEGVAVTTSAGVASTAEFGPLSPGDLYDRADGALYEAKRRGGNCVLLASRAG